MVIVGLTGNLASGKTEAAKLFQKKGAHVIDADGIARRLTQRNAALKRAIVKVFGKSFVGRGGQIDRRKLAWHVFSNPKDLRKLNVIVHPSVIFEIYKEIEKFRSKKRILVLDVPLLFESKMEKLADFTVVVKASEANMLSRASRRGIPAELARKILEAQWPVMKKARLADFVIDNNGTAEELERRVDQVVERILEKRSAREGGFYGTSKKI